MTNANLGLFSPNLSARNTSLFSAGNPSPLAADTTTLQGFMAFLGLTSPDASFQAIPGNLQCATRPDDSLVSLLQDLKDQISSLTDTIKKQNDRISSLTDTVDSQKSQIDALTRSNAEKDQKIADLEQKVNQPSPQPELSAPQPELSAPQPELSAPQPELSAPQPELSAPPAEQPTPPAEQPTPPAQQPTPPVAQPAQPQGPSQHDINMQTYRTLRDASAQNRNFDEQFYLQRYPDVAQAIANGSFHGTALQHYQQYGMKEGRYSNQYQAYVGETVRNTIGFDEGAYLAHHPDVAAAVQSGQIASGFAHFVSWGAYADYQFTDY